MDSINDDLDDDQELLNCISSDICNNAYSKTSEEKFPYSSEEHFNINAHIDGLEVPDSNNVMDNTNLQMDIHVQHENLNANNLQLNHLWIMIIWVQKTLIFLKVKKKQS